MLITILEARKIIGEANNQYSDEQITEVINIFTLLADLAIDNSIAKRKIDKHYE